MTSHTEEDRTHTCLRRGHIRGKKRPVGSSEMLVERRQITVIRQILKYYGRREEEAETYLPRSPLMMSLVYYCEMDEASGILDMLKGNSPSNS